MTAVRLLEGSALVALTVIWLGPLVDGVWRRRLSLLHPSAIFPSWVVLSVGVSMTVRWAAFRAGQPMPGLRITTRNLADDPLFAFVPLLLVATSGLAYHWGVRLGCGRVIANDADRTHLDPSLTTIGPPYGPLLFPAILPLVVALPLPFVLFGQGAGFFWAAASVYALGYLPVAVYRQRPLLGWVTLVACSALMGLRGSKGDYIYAVLPIFIFTQFRLGVTRLSHTPRVATVAIAVALVAVGTRSVVLRSGVDLEQTGLVRHILSREYGFEVFALLVDQDDAHRLDRDGSWLWGEVTEALPSGLGIPKRRLGTLVSRRYLPFDFDVIPEAGFNRFFLFPFFHDFGYPGVLVGGFLMGFGLAWPYERLRQHATRRRELWPLILYLPFPVYAELLVNGAFSYAAVHIAMAVLPLVSIFAIVRSRRIWGDPIPAESAT